MESSSGNAAQHTAQWYHQTTGSDAEEPWIALTSKASNDVVYGEASSTSGNVADVTSLNGFNVYVGYQASGVAALNQLLMYNPGNYQYSYVIPGHYIILTTDATSRAKG